MENDEIRMTNDETNLNHEIVMRLFQFGTLWEFAEATLRAFELRHSFVIRYSSFVILSSCPSVQSVVLLSEDDESNRLA